MKKLIPADTVDAAGNVWPTIGENIRNGAKENSEEYIKLLVNVMFPVGSVYCGENSFILSVGEWTQIKNGSASLVGIGTNTISGKTFSSKEVGSSSGTLICIRMWKREK